MAVTNCSSSLNCPLKNGSTLLYVNYNNKVDFFINKWMNIVSLFCLFFYHWLEISPWKGKPLALPACYHVRVKAWYVRWGLGTPWFMVESKDTPDVPARGWQMNGDWSSAKTVGGGARRTHQECMTPIAMAGSAGTIQSSGVYAGCPSHGISLSNLWSSKALSTQDRGWGAEYEYDLII